MTSSPIIRRKVLAVSALAAGGLLTKRAPALAQNYPVRPITLILPVSVGGSTDVLMRTAAPLVAKTLGQTVVVDARPGAGGALGASIVARAKPDGYTLLAFFGSNLMLPYVQQLTFDPLKDFSFIVGQHTFATAAVVRADSVYKSLGDLVAAAKANPGTISVGTAGVTSTGGLTIAKFEQTLGIKFLHIPYKGAEYNPALLGGHIDAIFSGPNWMGMVDSGQARALAIFDEKRVANYPDVPTAPELGIPIVETNAVAIVGPAGMSKELVNTLHDAFDKAHRSDEFQAMLKKLLCQFWNASGEELQVWAAKKHMADGEIAERLSLKP
jgi:tripartite-type tricarboxylate transporter receptor subunit TctC